MLELEALEFVWIDGMSALFEGVLAIRRDVFVEEQGVASNSRSTARMGTRCTLLRSCQSLTDPHPHAL